MTGERLLVLYDENCALCRRCRHWMESQPTYVPVDFLAAGSPAARERFGDVPWLGAELVVVDEDENVWIGPAAFLTCLWATEKYRGWSYRLSGRTFAPLARRFFHVVSSNRSRIAALVGPGSCDEGKCEHEPVDAILTLDTYTPPQMMCPVCHAPVKSDARDCWACGAGRSRT